MNIIWPLFETAVNMLECLIIADFVSEYLGNRYAGKKKVSGFLLLWLLLFINVTISNHVTNYEGIAIVIPIFICFVYSLFFLNGKVLGKLFVSVLVMAIIVIVNLLVMISISFASVIPVENVFANQGIHRVIAVISSKFLLFFVTRALLRIKSKNEEYIKPSEWVVTIVIPFISILIIIALLDVSLLVGQNDQIQFYLLLILVAVAATNIITYYLYIRTIRNNKLKIQYELLQQERTYQQEHIDDVRKLYEEIRQIRHDLKNNITCTAELVKAQKYDKALEYLNQSISRINHTRQFVHTSNDIVNSIINSKFTMAESNSIQVTCSVSDTIEHMDEIDVCILLGNLLDNAIEACGHVEGEKEIDFSMGRQKGYFCILIKNTIDSSVLKKNPKLKTSKTDSKNHGIGIMSVRNIVQKYNGMIDFYEEGNRFFCSVMLQLPESA